MSVCVSHATINNNHTEKNRNLTPQKSKSIHTCDLCSYYYTQHGPHCACAYCYKQRNNSNNNNEKVEVKCIHGGAPHQCRQCLLPPYRRKTTFHDNNNTNNSEKEKVCKKRKRKVNCYYAKVPQEVIVYHRGKEEDHNTHHHNASLPLWRIPKIGDCAKGHLQQEINQQLNTHPHEGFSNNDNDPMESNKAKKLKRELEHRWLSERCQFMY